MVPAGPGLPLPQGQRPWGLGPEPPSSRPGCRQPGSPAQPHQGAVGGSRSTRRCCPSPLPRAEKRPRLPWGPGSGHLYPLSLWAWTLPPGLRLGTSLSAHSGAPSLAAPTGAEQGPRQLEGSGRWPGRRRGWGWPCTSSRCPHRPRRHSGQQLPPTAVSAPGRTGRVSRRIRQAHERHTWSGTLPWAPRSQASRPVPRPLSLSNPCSVPLCGIRRGPMAVEPQERRRTSLSLGWFRCSARATEPPLTPSIGGRTPGSRRPSQSQERVRPLQAGERRQTVGR